MSPRHTLLGLLVVVVATIAPAPAAAAPQERIVVRYRDGVSGRERADVRADADAVRLRALPVDGVELLAADTPAASLETLRADPAVAWAERDRPVRAATPTPPDALWSSLWGLRNVGFGTVDADVDADEAWAVATGAGVTVGVVDTGVDAHDELDGKLVPGANFLPTATTDPASAPVGPTDTRDVDGHGTHVAGTIAAASNARDVVGVAPDAAIMPLRALGDDGGGWMSDVASAFDHAGDAGVRVVNASLSSPSAAAVDRQAMLDHPSTLYVVAAGNDGLAMPGDGSAYPCAYTDVPNLLCVGASTRFDAPASFSNRSATLVDLFAPGETIRSLLPGGGTTNKSGTSMAAPHVAGVAALLAEQHPSWTGVQIKERILASVDAPPALAGVSAGGGRLNAAAAVGAPRDPDGRPPSRPERLTGEGSGPGAVRLAWSASPERDVVRYEIATPAGTATWTSTTTATVSGLPEGSTQAFRVTAIDALGNRSPSTSEVRVPVPATPPSAASASAPATTPGEPPLTELAATPPALPTPSPTPTPTSPAPTLRVSDLRATGSTRAPVLTFHVSAPGTVAVVIQQRRGGRWAPARTKRIEVRPGVQRLTHRRLGLRRGTFRVQLVTAAGRASVTLRVR